jgi:uncharacterized membrane protein YcaP (DUF421 family)
MDVLLGLGGAIRDGLALDQSLQEPLSIGEMALRAALVYIIAVILLRLAERRFMTRRSPFDLVLAIIIGSVISRAITGNAPFVPTLVAALVLVLAHTALSTLAFRFNWLGKLVKGSPRTLVRDGHVDHKALRRSHIGERDLEAAVRRAGLTTIEQVGRAYLERDGAITIIEADDLDGDDVHPRRPVRDAPDESG